MTGNIFCERNFKMKKIITAVLSAAMCLLVFASCSGDNGKIGNGNNGTAKDNKSATENISSATSAQNGQNDKNKPTENNNPTNNNNNNNNDNDNPVGDIIDGAGNIVSDAASGVGDMVSDGASAIDNAVDGTDNNSSDR